MRYLILTLFILNACISHTETLFAQGPTFKRQKQKVLNLRKKLESVVEDKEDTEKRIESLQREIDEAELALIKRQIDEYEKYPQKEISLFIEEREALYRLIQTGEMSQAEEAQGELDRILRIITELSDETRHAY